MKAATAFVLVVLVLVLLIIAAAGYANDSAAKYVKAEAAAESMVLRAQSQDDRF